MAGKTNPDIDRIRYSKARSAVKDHGSWALASEALGISRRTLARWLRKKVQHHGTATP